MLSPEFQRLRGAGAVDTVRGEIARLEPGKAVISVHPPAPGLLTRCLGRSNQYAELREEATVPCDILVSATGFTKTYDYLPDEVRGALRIESDGLYLYRAMFPPEVPGLAFCGSEVATISNIATHGIHAEYIARVVNKELSLPDAEAMWEEVEATKTWKRSWMLPTHQRAALVLLHQTNYHDRLMEDMNLPWGRKGWNWLAEAFMPYQPRDYGGVIGSGPGAASSGTQAPATDIV